MSTSTHNRPRVCEHPPASRYVDEDEIICRRCTASLTYPPRAATPGNALASKRDIRAEAGEKRRTFTAGEIQDEDDGDDEDDEADAH